VPIFSITNYPTALSRFWLFGILIGFLLAYFPPKSRRARFLSVCAIIIGTYIIFPLSDLRRFAEDPNQQFEVPDLGEYLRTPDLDGMQSVMDVIAYTHQQGFLYGRQLLSTILFFVPRSVFPFKGEPTGPLVANFAGYESLNISCPIVGELYIDFAVPGLLIGGFLIGYLTRRADLHYSMSALSGRLTIDRLLYAVIAGFVVILSRGALLAVIGPIAAGTAPFLLLLAARDLAMRVKPQNLV